MKKIITTFLTISLCASNTFAQSGFQKTVGNGNAGVVSMKSTSDGGFILTGGISNIGAGQADLYLLKTDSNFDVEWSRVFGGVEYDYGWNVIQNMEGGYVSAGTTSSFGLEGDALFFIKTDSAGNILQSKGYGDYDIAYAFEVQQTIDSGYVIYGMATTPVGHSVMIKTDLNGDTLWTKTIAGQRGTSVITVNNGYILAGMASSSSSIYVTKTDNNGLELWTKGIQVNNMFSNTEKIKSTSDGGFILVGSNNNNVLLLKLDSLANVDWAKTYGGSSTDAGYDVQQTADGGFAVSGITYSFGNSFGDAYVLKTDSIGTLLWSKTYGDTGKESAYSIIENQDGSFMIAGGTWISGGAYLIKTDSIGNSGCNESSPSTVTNTPSIQYPSSVFSPGVCDTIISPTNDVDSSNTSYTLCPLITHVMEKLGNDFKFYPNPTTESITIELADVKTDAKVILTNSIGQVILTKNYSFTDIINLDLDYPKGLYFLTLETQGKILTKKIVLE